MITEIEIIARFSKIDVQVLEHWIAVGWLKPQRSEAGFLFDETDVARTHFLCDLCYEMELRDDELAMVLSLVDQLHGTRALLRAMTTAVRSQPERIRDAILAQAGLLLAPPDGER
jgi:chaperone modulatory protein CbpM